MPETVPSSQASSPWSAPAPVLDPEDPEYDDDDDESYQHYAPDDYPQ